LGKVWNALSNQEPILKINNIEVRIPRSHSGGSRGFPSRSPRRHRGLAGRQRRRQEHDPESRSGLLKHENGEVTDGSIEFMGARIDKMAAEKIAKLGIVK
jgi:branched-chain amino acid transport system ATP-binding protein